MNTLHHGGYTARIEFDARDEIFVGRVLGVRAIVSFHGASVDELRDAFAAAIREYLADCAERGVAPERPASGRLMLRVPSEVHSAAIHAAHSAGKSLNQWATEVLEDAARHPSTPAG